MSDRAPPPIQFDALSVSIKPHEQKGSEMGGMFQRDKEFGLDITDAFPLETPFILWGAVVQDEKVKTNTDFGDATKTRLIVQRVTTADDGTRKPEGQRFEVTTLASAIADKAADAEPDDFPCYCDIREVTSKRYGRTALVLQWIGDAGDDLSDFGGRMNAATGEIAADAEAPETASKRKSA